jgi:hypothetical protein
LKWTNFSGALISFFVAFAIGFFFFFKPPQVYKPFYYNTIIKWLGTPLGVSDLNVFSSGSSAEKHRQKNRYTAAYSDTGLGDLYDYSTITEHRLSSWKVNYQFGASDDASLETSIPVNTYSIDLQKTETRQNEKGEASTQSKSVFRGFFFRMKLNRPLDFTIRIDTNEKLLNQMAEATIQSMAGNKRLFMFNSLELENMFDCMIYPIDTNMGTFIGRTIQGTGASLAGNLVEAGLTRAGAVGKAAKLLNIDNMVNKGVRRMLSPSELRSLFKSAEDQENAHLKAKELITPQVEEFLLFLRKKYGPYTLVINKYINIQFSASVSWDNKRNVAKQKRRLNSLSGLFNPNCKDDKDIMCHSLLSIYESFMLAFLLGKYFDKVWRFDANKYLENADMYGDDRAFFDHFENWNAFSDKELNNSVKEYYQKICATYKDSLNKVSS